MTPVKRPPDSPIIVSVSRRVDKPGLCDVPDCVGWPWLQVQTQYANVIGAQNSNLCDLHGRAFLMGMGEMWQDTETPATRRRQARLRSEDNPVDAIAGTETRDGEITAHD
jgi:hypothetical protein